MMNSELMDSKKNTGYRLKEFRQLHNMTQSQLSEMLEKDLTTIQRYENGDILIPIDVALLIDKKYRMDLNYLYKGEESESEKDFDLVVHMTSKGKKFFEKEMRRLSDYCIKMITENNK